MAKPVYDTDARLEEQMEFAENLQLVGRLLRIQVSALTVANLWALDADETDPKGWADALNAMSRALFDQVRDG